MTRSALTRATVGSGLTGLLSQLALIPSGVIMARALGVEGRGYLALVMLVPFVLALYGSLGLPVASTYLLARQPGAFGGLLRALALPAVVQACVLTALHAVVVVLLFRGDERDVWAAALISLGAVPSFLALQYGLAFLQGRSRFGPFNALRVAPVVIFAVAVGGLAIAGGAGLVGFTVAWALTYGVVGLFTLAFAVATTPRDASARVNRSELLRYGSKGMLGATSPVESLRVDQLVAGMLLSPAALGVYVVGASLMNLPRFLAQSVGMVAIPVTAGRGGGGAYVRLTILLMLAIGIALEASAGWLIPFFFGDAFAESVVIARVLVVAAVLFGIRRVLIDVSLGAGRPAIGTVVEMASLFALVLLLVPLAKSYDVVGVAVAVTLAASVAVASAAGRLIRPYTFLPIVRRPARLVGPAGLAFGCGALSVVVGLAVVTFGDTFNGPANGLVPLITLGVALLPIGVRVLTRSFDLFEPIVGASAMLALLFGARPLVTGDQFVFGARALDEFRLPAELLGLLGTAALIAGYEFVRFRDITVLPTARRVYETPVTYFVLLAAAGVGFFVLHLSLGGRVLERLELLSRGRSDALAETYSTSSEYLSSAPILLACIAIIAVATAGHRFSVARGLLVVATVAFPVAIFFMSGARRFIIPSIALPLIVHYFMRRRRPRLSLVFGLAPLVFIAFATIPFIRSAGAREQAGGLVPAARQIVLSPGALVDRFMHGPDTDMIAPLALELQTLEHEGGFTYGQATLGDFLIAPIPSMAFPSKPMTARDEMLVATTGRACDVGSGGSCPDFTVVGTFYQDFGLAGVVVGMLGLGIAAAVIWSKLLVGALADPQRVVVAATCVVFLPIVIRAGFMPAFAWALYFLLPTLLGIRLARRTGDAPMRAPRSVDRLDGGRVPTR